MAESNDQEKTEPASPKKRQEARKKGQVVQSREIPSVLVLLGALSVFYFWGGWMFNQVTDIMRMVFVQMGQIAMGPETTRLLLWQLFIKIITLLAPLFLVVALAGVCGNIGQFGFLMTGEPLIPNLTKLNPLSGLQRLFSLRAAVELLKSILKVMVVGSVAYVMLAKELNRIPALVQLDTAATIQYMGSVSLKIGFYTCLVLVVLAGVDYLFQRWQTERDMRMTKQEVKDEHKQREGDPMVRSRIRSAQREIAMRRMMTAVPEATVVITNPTHLAVALKFERSMPAPMVVAKGAGLIAERIKAIAQEHDVPVLEQKPLARALYKNVQIDQYIPADLYHAVAEVLAYVYRLKGLVG